MFRAYCCVVLLITCIIGNAQKINYSLSTSPSIDYQLMQQEFRTVPDASRLRCYWWWLNSMATKASITRDLEQMKKMDMAVPRS